MNRSSDKLLVIMVAGIAGFIVIGVVALFFVGNRGEAVFAPGSPEAVTQNYLKALEDQDWEEAYGYLSESVKSSRVRDSYIQRKGAGHVDEDANRRIVLERSEVTGTEAKITISISTFRSSGPMETSDYTSRIDFRLQKEGDYWKITAPTYPPYF